MRAGRLNQRITIQSRSATRDALGQPVETWSDVASLWADIRFPSGMEVVKGGAEVSIVKASIRIRYRTDIDAGMRVEHGSNTYDVKAVLPDVAGRQHLDLVCERTA